MREEEREEPGREGRRGRGREEIGKQGEGRRGRGGEEIGKGGEGRSGQQCKVKNDMRCVMKWWKGMQLP